VRLAPWEVSLSVKIIKGTVVSVDVYGQADEVRAPAPEQTNNYEEFLLIYRVIKLSTLEGH
jgi:hypothetical protein